MHPILLRIDFPAWLPFLGEKTAHLYSYGLLVALGFLGAIWLAGWRSRKEGEDPERVLDLCFWIIVGSIAGARLLYVLLSLREYLYRPLSIFAIWEGGLVFYGGFAAGAAVAWFYTRRYKLSFL